MAISRTRALDHAESVLNRPQSDVSVVLRRNRAGGVSLLHRGRVLTKTHPTKVGEQQAGCMALALGVTLPSTPGASVETHVGTGVLYRAVAVSALDLRRDEAIAVMGQLLSTAALQRGVFKTVEVS
jgi:hypothetical protein